MSDRETTTAYIVNAWDCPYCGAVMYTDADLSRIERCEGCMEEVEIL